VATTAVCVDCADADPALFVAVTLDRNVDPLSAAATTYDRPVAPETATQLPPLPSHLNHWYA